MNDRFKPRARRCVTASLEGLAPHVTLELTSSGFTAELVRPPTAGSHVSGQLTLDGFVFPFQAEVTFSQPLDPRLSVRGRLSARFTQVEEGFFEALRG